MRIRQQIRHDDLILWLVFDRVLRSSAFGSAEAIVVLTRSNSHLAQ